MLVDVPDSMGADISALISAHMKNIEAKKIYDEEIARLNSSASLLWFENGFIGRKILLARESEYSAHISPYRYIGGYMNHNGVADPPVIMAGSKYSLHRRYCKGTYGSAPNGWNEMVAERYLRRIKFTSLGYNWEHREKPSMAEHVRVARKISAKYGGTYFNNPTTFDERVCYIEGIRYYVQDGSMPIMRKLLKHITDITDIERAMDRIGVFR